MSTDLVPVLKEYPVLAGGTKAVGEVVQALKFNMGEGEKLTVFDLSRIRIPTGGQTVWNLGDEEEPARAVEGIILHVTAKRAYWHNPTPKEGNPPDCQSEDCVIGRGDPGGRCVECPFDQFGTGPMQDGKPGPGKGCKEVKCVFLLRQGNRLPHVLFVTPGSFKPFRSFIVSLSKQAIPYFRVLTRFELEKATATNGAPFAKIKATASQEFPPEFCDAILAYANGLREVFARVQPTYQDVAGDGEPGGNGHGPTEV